MLINFFVSSYRIYLGKCFLRAQLKGIANFGLPACSPSVSLDGESSQCAVACKRGFQSDGSAIGAFTCDLGQLKGPGQLPHLLDSTLVCKRIRCDTTQLQTGGQFKSKRTDKFQGVQILEFEQKVSFACKEGFEIKDKESFDPSNDDQICDRYWQSDYEPEHNILCKA